MRFLADGRAARWTFTDTVVVDEKTRISHSHPILTLSTRYTGDPLMLLSVYLHENLHWYFGERRDAIRAAVEDLKKVYPNAPIAGSDGGAGNVYSTYMHLVNCWLEIEAMSEVAGRDAANYVLQKWSRHHYTWIYGRVMEEPEVIGAIVRKHGLVPPEALNPRDLAHPVL